MRCVPSIGPGGIEIGITLIDRNLLYHLQSDQVELKWERVVGTAQRAGLQSDQVELKYPAASELSLKDIAFNRTRWN